MARLVLSLDSQVLAEYNMSKERYTIGRLPDNDVRIDNPTVSGHHSLIINILNDSFLEDLNSTNGTYVNGKLIKKHALQNGDVVTVGKHQLRFIDGSEEEENDDEFSRTMVMDNSEIAASYADAAEAGPPQAAATPDAAAETRNPLMETMAPDKTSKPLPIAKIQVLNGTFAGREVPLNKALTTLGRAGLQVIAITKRVDGYYVIQVENAPDRKAAQLNGEDLGSQAHKLNDNDVIELIGIKMGFFVE